MEDGERTFTYADLDAAAGAIAAELHRHAITPEEPVAICLPRSWEAVAAYAGVLRAGAAYVPVNPEHPARRQAEMLEIAASRIALTAPDRQGGLPPEVIRLDAGRLVERGGSVPIEEPAGGDRLAYILFTSGSTGRPKGVEVTHANLSNLICSASDIVPAADDRVLHVVSLDFDVSGLEIWGALANGACLVVAPSGRPDPERLGRLIAESQITFMCPATGVFHELVRAALPELRGVRRAVPIGDVLSPDAARALRREHPGTRVINGYGPTEATILATSFELGEDVEGPVPIGLPLPGYEIHLLDDNGLPVGDGESGEIWIGGAGVARGYRLDPERTAERFRPDESGAGTVYRTGDHGRRREDGELLFLGRLDRQVKIAGQRVELGEIEHALGAHPGVREASVVAEERVMGHRRLIAHVVPAGGAPPAPPELRAFLETRLPRHLVPHSFVVHEELPLTDRGKVDRAALERIGSAPANGDHGSAGDEERVVRSVMAELLELDDVGGDDNLFDLGGDSLLAIGLLGLVRDRLGVELAIDAVFESPTPAALAERIGLAQRPEHPRPRLGPGPRRSNAPLSFAQRRAWLFGKMHPESIAYQFAALFRIRGELDRHALVAALGDLIARHEILRTAFVQRGDAPVQLISDEAPPRLDEVDLRGADSETIEGLIAGRIRTRIDPGDAPLVRWTLLRLASEEWALVHVEHHLVHDGWSFAVLADELSELYSAHVEDRSPALAAPTLQFRDYAVWERSLAASGAIEDQLAHWRRTLDRDAPLIDLPADRPRGARESFTGGSVRHRMDREPTQALAHAARAEGATLFMSALAAFAVLLRRHSGLDDLQIGSGVANRAEPETRRLLGMIVNTIVFRIDLSGDPTLAELLRRVRRVALEAYANADAPFDSVVDELAPARHPSRSPLINVLFSFHDSPRGPERWSGLDVRIEQVLSNGSAKADLNVIGVDDQDGGITFVWEHSDLFEDATVDRLAEEHLELMRKFARSPGERLSELGVGPDRTVPEISEAHVVRGPETPYDRDRSIPDVFRERAREQPDSVALDLEGSRLSYAELDARSDRIARHLVARGAHPGDRVGVLVHRSLDCYALLLAVLKAGAAYVALDPDWPAARIELIAGDAGLELVLTEESLRRLVPRAARALPVEELGDAPELKLPAGLAPLSAAYVAYTSGSTGTPKGVEVPHRAILRLVQGQEWVRLGPGETLLAAAPIPFDASTFEIWGALLSGARLAVFPPEPPTVDALDEVIRRQRVTTLWLTAGLFHRSVELELDTLRAVDQLIAGGEVLAPARVARARELMRPEAVLINGYGPTEATTFTCTHRIEALDDLDGGPVPIGHPLANTHVVVMDDSGRSLPPGAVGELWIGGDGVANGYLGDPALTAERFVPDPIGGGRLYRSGDLARVGADGAVEFLGRRDRQVKVRGHRVEPAEIEDALARHPGVAEVVVEPEREADGQLRVAAYYVARAGHCDWHELRAWAGDRLPAAFIPARWHELRELPLTANGKIDRERLSKLEPPAQATRRGRGGRRDTLEDQLCEIWRATLDIDAVSAEDDFFELGGHSLLAVSLFGEIERRLGVELPLAALFSSPTPEAMADGIRARGWRQSWEPLVSLRAEGSRPAFFCVTAGDGNAVGFGALARRLSPEQPFYALQPPGLDGRHRFPASVEEMAERYLREIRRVAPRGPYLLGGRCLGTKVALELAQRLKAGGEEVALLAILDDLEGPAAMEVTLPGGVPYGEVLSRLRARARSEGVVLDDIESFEGGAALLAYAREPVLGVVPRLLHEVWLEQAEVREAFPDIANGDGPRLIDWAWEYGRDLFDLPEGLLPPPPTARLVTDRRSERGTARALVSDRVSVAAEWVDVAARGRLPGARERRELRLRRIARRANERYRARPYAGRITHLASAERAQQLTARRWYDIAQGGVEEHVLDVTHRSMLRVPGVAELAACLDACIMRALG